MGKDEFIFGAQPGFVRCFHFFVPYRLVWSDWAKYWADK